MSVEKTPFRPVDDSVRREARKLLHEARFGALATLDPQSGYPMASRILVATDYSGAPVTLISTLASHTKALLKDNRCSLMVGEPGKGDPLASPRVMLTCDSVPMAPESPETQHLKQRFVRKHPKTKLYVDFADFSFVKLDISYGIYNGGFGRAFRVEKQGFQSEISGFINNSEIELELMDLITESYPNEINAYVNALPTAARKNWKIRALDDLGIDFEFAGVPHRFEYTVKIGSKEDLKTQITAMIINMF